MNSEVAAPHTFLIVRTDRLGDVVLTLPMARAIKKASPLAKVLFLVRNYTEPIIELAPDVDDVLIAEETTSFRELLRIFRSTKCDFAFFPSPKFHLALAAFLARVPIRVGTAYRWYSLLFSRRIFEHRRTAEHHEAEYNLRMLAQAGILADRDELPDIQLSARDRNAVNEWLSANLPDSSSRFAVLHCTIAGSSYPWPSSNFVELGRRIAGKQGMTIILTGLRQESEALDRFAAEIGDGFATVFAGHSLGELSALLERAELVVSASTGPGHLAAALGTPTIGLFPLPKPLSKQRWGFRGPHVTNLSPDPLPECPNCEECTCMERLEVQIVWSAAEAAIAARLPT